MNSMVHVTDEKRALNFSSYSVMVVSALATFLFATMVLDCCFLYVQDEKNAKAWISGPGYCRGSTSVPSTSSAIVIVLCYRILYLDD